MAVSTNGAIFTMEDINNETFGDLLGQLGTILGVGKRSNGRYYLADMCQAEDINRWARYKPLKVGGPSGPLTEAERRSVGHGLIQNSDYYLEYDRVTAGWWNRIRDFDGYNAGAIPPIASTAQYNMELSFSGGSSGKIVFAPDDLIVAEAEIPLNEIAHFRTYKEWYVGVMFLNKSTGKGYYHTYEWKLDTIVNGDATASESVGTEAEAPNIVDGGTYHFYYCLGMEPNIRYAELTEDMIGSSIYVLCCDSSHGHAIITAKKMGWNYISTQLPRFYCSYSGSGSATLGISQFDLLSSWDFASYPMTNQLVYVEIDVGGNRIRSNPTSYHITQYNTSIEFTQYAEFDSTEIINEWEYIVPIAIYAKFENETSFTRLAHGTYDVRNGGSIVTWEYN